MSDNHDAFRQTCNDYLRQYHSAKVPAPQPEQPDRGGDGVKVAATVPFVRLPDDPLIISGNCAPDAVLAKLRQMFPDPAWWAAFVREVIK